MYNLTSKKEKNSKHFVPNHLNNSAMDTIVLTINMLKIRQIAKKFQNVPDHLKSL